MKWNKVFLINIFMLLALMLSPVHAAYYGLFETPSTTDSMAVMKSRKNDENIVWYCPRTKITHKLQLRRSRYKLSKDDQSMHELSEPVNVVVSSPFAVVRMTKAMTFKDMGFPTEDWLEDQYITLTFKRSGAPDTLYVGMPAPEKEKPAPKIVEENGKSMFVCRGECRNFRASVPKGLPESNLIYNWYIDGELMTGRNDRWFETYSRTNLEDGEHIISCDVRVGENGRQSPRAEYKIVQSTNDNCVKSVRAIPYWGVECANESDPSDFRWNETCEWGSFSWIPIENYSHFYLEAINRKIVAKKITNDPDIKHFQLVEDSEVDDEYKFFDLPLNVKAYAEEPFEGQTIYFRFIGDTIHYTTTPYIRPYVEVSPTYIDICENAFDSEKIELTAKSTGFMPGTAHYVWMYSKERDGVYEEVKAPHVRNFVPSRAGFYKVKATDRVYSCESEPVEAGLKTTDCQPVEIICPEKDYVCKGTTTLLKSSLVGDSYKYKWYVGRDDATDVDDLREIEGETSSTLLAGANRIGEGYFLQVEKDHRTILSYPFHVRKLATLNGNLTVDLQTFPATVCEGSIVNVKASVLTNVFDFDLINGTYDYRFFKKSLYDYDYYEVKYVKGTRSTAVLQEVASAAASYKVEVIGCNAKTRIDEPVDVVPRNDNSCNSNEIYVKEDGNDDENDGRSWATAFQSLDRAIQEVEAMRSTQTHASDLIEIHLAEQVYTPTSEDGFVFPSNVTVYGGYDISPVDGTASGKVRNPRTPANPEGNMTVFKVDDPNARLTTVIDKQDIKFCGIIFDGSSLAAESSLNGRAMKIVNSTVTIDSCFINGFYFKSTSDNPVTAIAIEKGKNNKEHSKVSIKNTTLSQIKGGQVGACISVMDDSELEIWNSCFTNNSSLYKGGVTLLSYNVSPKINIYNSTFYDNQCTSPIGYYGRVLMRFIGGNPTVNIYSSTLSGRFYKEAGTLKIYNSLVECAGRCDEYVNNYPAKSKFVEATKDANETAWAKAFLANFKGTIASKLSTRGGITQVLMPSNKLEIVGQAGAPHKLTPYDQRGIQRSSISSTYGACDADYSAVIEITDQGCPDHKNTRASFKSTIAGLTEAMYQWVDNYNDLPNEKKSTMTNAPLGTYWLEVKGIDAMGNYVTVSSNEIRVSDVCEEPGIFYVKTLDKGGSDEFAGTTWDQAFESLEKALAVVAKYKKENGADAPATIHMAGGEYTLKKDAGLVLGDLKNVTILGGYSSSPVKGAKRAQKRTPSDPGFETRIMAHSEKGKFATFTSSNKDFRFATIHFVGTENGINPFFTMNGGSLRLDSCLVSGCWSENDAPFLSLLETSKLIVNSCYVYSNKAANGAFLNVENKGNKSTITICASTFSDNTSVKNGGAVIYTGNNSAPTINVVNTTMFNNSCINNAFAGVENIRLSSGRPTLNAIHSTLCGPYYIEQGNATFSNCIVEAVGNANVNGGYKQSKTDLTSVAQAVSPADHEEFKTLFSNIKLGSSNTPVLTFVKDMTKVSVTKASCPDCSIEADQAGTPRRSETVTPGAVEQ